MEKTKPNMRCSRFRVIGLITLMAFLVSQVDPVYASVQISRGTAPQEYRPIFHERLEEVFPYEYGTIQEIYASDLKGAEGLMPPVYLIQDAHANSTAQRNIAQLLEWLASHEANRNPAARPHFLAEGIEGRVDLSPLQKFRERAVREIGSDLYLENALLTGPSYAAVRSEKEIVFVGGDINSLYEENLKLYGIILERKERVEKILQAMASWLSREKRKTFSKGIKSLEEKLSGFQKKTLSLVEYVKFLMELV